MGHTGINRGGAREGPGSPRETMEAAGSQPDQTGANEVQRWATGIKAMQRRPTVADRFPRKMAGPMNQNAQCGLGLGPSSTRVSLLASARGVQASRVAWNG